MLNVTTTLIGSCDVRRWNLQLELHRRTHLKKTWWDRKKNVGLSEMMHIRGCF